ncbi:N-acetylmuramoyl-L-alanine amidase [Viridibacillus sp. NPDC093762]|uniref:N-acetylmuramoyl-L-alanine amidase n=1 Tax=Viridibacillus sp. NPDC093762 TaxID=3390720 RepID=UPI003D01717D
MVLKDELGVAMSGVKWDIGNFKLWQSTRDDIILFTPKQPVLAKGANGRYQIGVSSYRQQTEGTYKITGGTAIFTITSAIQYDEQEMANLKEQWRSVVVGSGDALTDNPKFVPLNIRKGEAQVLINEVSGVQDKAHNDKEVGTPGGTNSFLIKLTELGAQEWTQGIKNKTAIPAGVKFMYEYLQLLPTVGATVKLHAQRVFEHISAALKVSYDGWFYGGSAQIDAVWEKMTREGVIEIIFEGTASPEVEALRAQLVTAFSTQAQQEWFKTLFEPKPDVKPAEAGNTSGWFGGANFAFKYKKATEMIDLEYKLKFEGWTWLKASMDVDLVTLFKDLDESYVTEVNTQQSFPISVVVDSDEILENVPMSISASEGLIPAAPVFQKVGGTNTFICTSLNPANVIVNYRAQINYANSKWPIIEKTGSKKESEGGNQIVIKPSAWVGRHKIFMFVREGDKIVSPDKLSKDDYIVVNVSYQGPHLSETLTESGKITPLEILEFSYPLDPNGQKGQAKFSAFGVIGGSLVRGNEQPISFDEEAVFILADKNGIQLVSKATVLGEGGRGGLPERLVNRFSGRNPGTIIGESTRPNNPTSNQIVGYIQEIEYGKELTFLIKDEDGTIKRIGLHDKKMAEVLKNACSKKVRVILDSSGKFAEKISILLSSDDTKNDKTHSIEGPIPVKDIVGENERSGADYPLTSRYVPAKYYKESSLRTINRIVIHITDGGSNIDGTVGWFQNPVRPDGTGLPVSAHYVVGQDGEVVQMVKNKDIAYHASSANPDSIGIEHVARAPGAFGASDGGLSPTAIQYASSAALVRWLCEEYQIPMERDYILGHSEADPNTSHVQCPNAVWDWDYFMEMVTTGMSL